jgi:hypothetical protein
MHQYCRIWVCTLRSCVKLLTISEFPIRIFHSSLLPQSTFTVPRVPECLFPCRNWELGPPTPSPANEWGVGESNSDDWRKSIPHCQLCDFFWLHRIRKSGRNLFLSNWALENSIRDYRGDKTKVFVTNLLSFGVVAAVRNNTKRIILFPIKSATKRNHLSS